VLDQALTSHEVAAATDRLVVGGEQLHGPMLARWTRHAPDTVIVNEYGPTETTVGCTWFATRAGDVPGGVVPIGTPVANTTVRVLDAALRPVPVGVYGDLWVGGAQVTRGYRSAPRQTAERFVPDPYAAAPGARMYQTGDVARFHADGVLEYAGRADDQVKVRGYRVVPHEVAAAITAHPAVTEAVVVVPVIRRRSPVESEVAAVVGALLGNDDPDLDENFFDLGGDSLLAMKAVSRLRARYRVSLTVMDLFATASLAELATRIESKLDIPTSPLQ
jgi:acyl-coenzyme A synthetase/AMP-(fatty) acid ligase